MPNIPIHQELFPILGLFPVHKGLLQPCCVIFQAISDLGHSSFTAKKSADLSLSVLDDEAAAGTITKLDIGLHAVLFWGKQILKQIVTNGGSVDW